MSEGLSIDAIREQLDIPPVAAGYARNWRTCNVCGHVGFHDYVPYGLSTPILVMPCGHPGHYEATTRVTEAEGLTLALAQHEARGAA